MLEGNLQHRMLMLEKEEKLKTQVFISRSSKKNSILSSRNTGEGK